MHRVSSYAGLLKTRVSVPFGDLVAEFVFVFDGIGRDFKLSDDLIRDALLPTIAFFLNKLVLADVDILFVVCSALLTVYFMVFCAFDVTPVKEVGTLSLLMGETAFYVVRYLE